MFYVSYFASKALEEVQKFSGFESQLDSLFQNTFHCVSVNFLIKIYLKKISNTIAHNSTLIFTLV